MRGVRRIDMTSKQAAEKSAVRLDCGPLWLSWMVVAVAAAACGDDDLVRSVDGAIGETTESPATIEDDPQDGGRAGREPDGGADDTDRATGADADEGADEDTDEGVGDSPVADAGSGIEDNGIGTDRRSSDDGTEEGAQDAGRTSPAEDGGSPGCTGAGDCDDGVDCTLDSCAEDGLCHHDAASCECLSASDCSADVACITATCTEAGTCDFDDGRCECLNDGDCDDGDAATLDACNATERTCAHRRVTYADDMQAIFRDRCVPCHTTAPCAAARCFVDDDSDMQALVTNQGACLGMTVAACIRVRVQDGTMPPTSEAGCSGDPAMDSGNTMCLTPEEHELLNAWIAGDAP